MKSDEYSPEYLNMSHNTKQYIKVLIKLSSPKKCNQRNTYNRQSDLRLIRHIIKLKHKN